VERTEEVKGEDGKEEKKFINASVGIGIDLQDAISHGTEQDEPQDA